jgi:hypothetical protein
VVPPDTYASCCCCSSSPGGEGGRRRRMSCSRKLHPFPSRADSSCLGCCSTFFLSPSFFFTCYLINNLLAGWRITDLPPHQLQYPPASEPLYGLPFACIPLQFQFHPHPHATTPGGSQLQLQLLRKPSTFLLGPAISEVPLVFLLPLLDTEHLHFGDGRRARFTF